MAPVGAEGGVERREGAEVRGDVRIVGAGLGRAACDAAAAAELGINGKSFGRLRRILRSLRDGSGGPGDGQNRSARVGGSSRRAAEGGGWPGLRRPAGPGREARRGVEWGERQGSAAEQLRLPDTPAPAGPRWFVGLLAPRRP